MTRMGTPQLILTAIAIFLTACPSDSLPPAQPTPNTSQKPDDTSSSGTIPPAPPKPTDKPAGSPPADKPPAEALKIVVPGVADGSIPIGEQGKPYSLGGIKVLGGGAITIVDCLPTKNGSVVAANDGTYTLNITTLPDQEVKCTLQAKKDGQTTLVVVTIPVNTPPPPVYDVSISNVPTSVSVTGGLPVVIDNIYVSGFVPKTVLTIACQQDKKAAVTQLGDSNSPLFKATIATLPGTPDGSSDDSCTIAAAAPNGKSAEAKLVVHSLPEGKKPPHFTPENFKAGDIIPLVAQGWLGYYSMIDAKAHVYPRIEIFDPDGIQSIAIQCSENNKLGPAKATSQLVPGTAATYQIVVQYNYGSAPEGGFVTETCSLLATDKTGLPSSYELTLKPQ